MTKVERAELSAIVKRNIKVAVGGLQYRAADVRADFEARLAQEYKAHDQRWEQAVRAVHEAVELANARIAEVVDQFGDPEAFKPSVHMYWSPRRENGD